MPPVTKDVPVVLKLVVSSDITTCKTLPLSVGTAKVLSPLKKVVISLVPVAVSLASETVLSEGVPMSKFYLMQYKIYYLL